MKKKLNSLIIFYVLYFTWLFLIAYLWPNTTILSFFLLSIVGFYFLFLKEKLDIIVFGFVVTASIIISRELAIDPEFASVGFPPLGVPYWPTAWGITALALRKFYLLMSSGLDED